MPAPIIFTMQVSNLSGSIRLHQDLPVSLMSKNCSPEQPTSTCLASWYRLTAFIHNHEPIPWSSTWSNLNELVCTLMQQAGVGWLNHYFLVSVVKVALDLSAVPENSWAYLSICFSMLLYHCICFLLYKNSTTTIPIYQMPQLNWQEFLSHPLDHPITLP